VVAVSLVIRRAGAILTRVFLDSQGHDAMATGRFAFVTECQMAHVTCLAVARRRLLAHRGWDLEQRGPYGV
jgi:hypothetical protein